MKEQEGILILSRNDIENIFSPIDIIHVCEYTFKLINSGKIEQVHGEQILNSYSTPTRNNFFRSYIARLKDENVCGIKWLSVYHGNLKKGLPYHHGLCILSDCSEGIPLAVMEAVSITSLRTAGHAAIGAKYLARKDSRIISFIGCGREARWHFKILKELFDLEEVRLFDISENPILKFKEEIEKYNKYKIKIINSIKEAVFGSDIVCEVTTDSEPTIRNDWIGEGCHVVGTNVRGIDPLLLKNVEKWVIGNREADLKWIEAKKDRYSKDFIYSSLSEIVAGDKPGREDNSERTVMTHCGMGALDVVSMEFIYQKALKMGVGTKLKLF